MENNRLIRRSFQSSLNRGFKRPMGAQSGMIRRGMRISPITYISATAMAGGKGARARQRANNNETNNSSVPPSPVPLFSPLTQLGPIEELKNEATTKIEKQDCYVSFLKLEQFGRLGNQMFQIAAVLGFTSAHPDYKPGFIAWKYNCFLTKPLPSLPQNWKSNLIFQTYDEPHFHWADIPAETIKKEQKSSSLNLSGYFQSIKYFEKCKGQIYDTFDLNPKYKAYIDKLVKKHDLISEKYEVIGVHVRKGDYVNGNYHIDLQRDYYEKAWAKFLQEREEGKERKEKKKRPLAVLICSDDINWCRLNLSGVFELAKKPTKIVYSENEPDIIDMHLLAQCQHLIIANSSFSWWSAFLAETKDRNSIIIAPKNCFHNNIDVRDLFPDSWIRV